jgi:hypothetical protein
MFEHMTVKDLRNSLEECDDERKMLARQARGREFTNSEKEQMNIMNDWAEKVFGEIMTRKGYALVHGQWLPANK